MKIKKGISLIDQHDKFGMWGPYGGNFLPETLRKPVTDLEKLFEKLRKNKKFVNEWNYHLKNFVGTPTSFVKLKNLSNYLGGAQIYAKVVSEAKGGAHKCYGALTHAMLCKYSNRNTIATDTGAGYNGKTFSIMAKYFGLKLLVFMGKKDILRQKPNCDAMRANGATIIPVTTGGQGLCEAVSELMRYWVSNCDRVHVGTGSTVGANIFIKICGWSVSQISKELKLQIINEFGRIPKKLKLLNCVGGGSSSFGLWNSFIDYDKEQVELIGVEAGGPKRSKLHAAPLSHGAKVGVLHGSKQRVLMDNDGQILHTDSISAGLDYPGVSPLHCFLQDSKRARYVSQTDEQALSAYKLVTKYESHKVSPSLEPAHSFSYAIKIAPKLSKDTILVVNSCGDSFKDKDIIKKRLGKYSR
tara:strand:- start:5315 stop:6553 length:1239 start_codon:yes stop_codon:yes gene_type:complete